MLAMIAMISLQSLIAQAGLLLSGFGQTVAAGC